MALKTGGNIGTLNSGQCQASIVTFVSRQGKFRDKFGRQGQAKSGKLSVGLPIKVCLRGIEMNTVEFVQQQFKQLHQRIDDVLANTTTEHFNWQPPGVANPIGATFLHMLNAEDFHIQTILQEQRRVWESEGWGTKLAWPPRQGKAVIGPKPNQ